MRHGTTFCVALALACSDDPTEGDTVTEVRPLEVGTDPPPPEDTDAVPPSPTEGCFADVTLDIGDDGTSDGGGTDLYDPVRTDLLVHVERMLAGVDAYERDIEYDSLGNIVRSTVDEGSDGIVDSVVSYTRDADGRPLTETLDDDGDGVSDDVRTFTWNEEGLLLAFTQDYNGDGDPDYAFEYTWVAGVRVTSTEDRDGDEVVDISFTYTYDDVGRPTLVEGDSETDGSINYVLTRTYTDPVLLVGSTLIDEHNDGKPDFADTFVYDAEERLWSTEHDVGVDGFVDYVGAWTYTTDGLLASADEQRISPPPYDNFVDWTHVENTYDEEGRLIDEHTDGQYVDADEDRSRLGRQTWTFGGTCP
jgi:hypothetical protein